MTFPKIPQLPPANPAAVWRDLPRAEMHAHHLHPAAHKMRRISGILKGLRPLSKGFQGGQRPPWRSPKALNIPPANPAAVRRDLPRVETHAHHSHPAAHKMRRQSGIPKGLRPFGRGFQGGQRPPWQSPLPPHPRAAVAACIARCRRRC